MQELTGTEYVKIDLANQFGLDRLSWKDRMFWVNDNRPNLNNLISSAKNPLAFKKALRALVCAERDVPTNHIMGLDATASGIQIMAVMSGCRSSAKTVNLINTGNREDVYDAIAQEMSACMNLEIARDTVKKPIMTFFYGSQAVPKRIFGEGEALTAFHSTMANTLPGPYELMKLFQSSWDPQASQYEWAMPDGHVVHVPVTVKEDKGLEIDEADHIRFTYRAEIVKPQLLGRSLAANIVHSVDGYICRQMVKKAKAQGFFMSPIHDCFYAHPNNMNVVRQSYRECLADVAGQNLVTAILSQIAGRRVSYCKISNDLEEDILLSEYALS